MHEFMLKYSTIVGGFIGGFLSLYFRDPTSVWRSVVALLGSVACGGYGTPIAVTYLPSGIPMTEQVYGAVAVILGLVGMNIFEGVFTLSQAFRKGDFSLFHREPPK